jgi:hypothetical protein
MKKNNLNRLIEVEKLLYLEVEQLRSRLYLHDSSLIFEFFSAFYFAGQDIKKLFVKEKTQSKLTLESRKKSIASLTRKKKFLEALGNTPYAWLINALRSIKNSFMSFRAAPKRSGAEKSQKNKSFLIFGSTSSQDLQSRSLQIARQLSKKNKVIYIEGIFEEGRIPGFRIIESTPHFTAIRLTAIKPIHLNYQKPKPKEIHFLKRSMRLSTLDFKLSDSQVYIHHPFWASILSLKKNSFTFDHAEDFAHIKNAAPHIITSEKNLQKNAQIVTAPHKKLLRKNVSSSHSRGGGNPVSNSQLKSSRDLVIKNGVDWHHFKDTSKMIQTCDVGLCWIKKPVLGFIGTLDERVDEVLLGHLAASFPSASIVLVGNTDYRPVIEVAEQHPNIFPVGKQPYAKLPLFIQSFDILITPYKYNKSAIIVHPELPLYLTSGKPIVAPSATAAVACGAIYQPKSHTDWVIAIAEALKEKKRSKKRFLRISQAKKLVWKVPRKLSLS